MKNKPITFLNILKIGALCLISALAFSSCGSGGSMPNYEIKPGTWVTAPDGSQTFR